MSRHGIRRLLTKLIFTLEKRFLPLVVLQEFIIAFKRFIVYEFDLKERTLDAVDTTTEEQWSKLTPPLEIRRADLDKMPTLAEMRTSDLNFGEDRVRKGNYTITVLERLRTGHWCVAAERGDKILGYLWIAFGELYDKATNRRAILREDEALIYDVYVASEQRRKGLMPRIVHQALDALRENNCRKAYILVEDYNKPSRKGVERSGGTAKATITRVKILNMNRLLLTPTSSILDLRDNGVIAFT